MRGVTELKPCERQCVDTKTRVTNPIRSNASNGSECEIREHFLVQIVVRATLAIALNVSNTKNRLPERQRDDDIQARMVMRICQIYL